MNVGIVNLQIRMPRWVHSFITTVASNWEVLDTGRRPSGPEVLFEALRWSRNEKGQTTRSMLRNLEHPYFHNVEWHRMKVPMNLAPDVLTGIRAMLEMHQNFPNPNNNPDLMGELTLRYIVGQTLDLLPFEEGKPLALSMHGNVLPKGDYIATVDVFVETSDAVEVYEETYEFNVYPDSFGVHAHKGGKKLKLKLENYVKMTTSPQRLSRTADLTRNTGTNRGEFSIT